MSAEFPTGTITDVGSRGAGAISAPASAGGVAGSGLRSKLGKGESPINWGKMNGGVVRTCRGRRGLAAFVVVVGRPSVPPLIC